MDYEPVIKEQENKTVDTLKIDYFEKFIQLAREKKINLVCCVSPTYKARLNDDYYTPIKQLCSGYEIPFLDLNASPQFINEKKYFEDRVHLNDMGAHLFTSMLIPLLREVGNIDSE